MSTFSLLGSGRFSFSAGSTKPATPTDPTLYPVKFAECPVEMDVTTETVDNEEPVNGVLQITRSAISKAAFEYTLKLKSFDFNVLSFFLGGPTPTTATPPTTIAVGTDLAHTGYGIMEWFDNGDSSGTPSRKHTGFSCQIVPDGNLSLDPKTFTELSIKVKITSDRGVLA